MYEVTDESVIRDGWKVCCCIEGEFDRYYRSVCGSSIPMAYHAGEWTKRREGWGPLAVFESYFAASEFVEDNNSASWSLITLTCKYTPSSDRGLWQPAEAGTLGWDDVLRVFHSQAPEGTVYADAVMIMDKASRKTTQRG